MLTWLFKDMPDNGQHIQGTAGMQASSHKESSASLLVQNGDKKIPTWMRSNITPEELPTKLYL